jgi:hypothetical protein
MPPAKNSHEGRADLVVDAAETRRVLETLRRQLAQPENPPAAGEADPRCPTGRCLHLLPPTE